jgi:Pyridoxamine 5'-phosphate oxidase
VRSSVPDWHVGDARDRATDRGGVLATGLTSMGLSSGQDGKQAGMHTTDVAEILNKPLSQEMLNRDLARLAYVAKDGTPRVVPIGFTWNGSEVVMCTATNAPKLVSLRRNPAVALTIDTEVHPPNVLLIRGEAVLDEVEGIPDEYLKASGTYKMTPEQRVEWEAGVRSLYDSMVRIVVRPTWAKLIDFDETLPTPVEELVRRREERGSA